MKDIDYMLNDINADIHALDDKQKRIIQNMVESKKLILDLQDIDIKYVYDDLRDACLHILDSYREILAKTDIFSSPLHSRSLLFSFSDNEKKNAQTCLDFYDFLKHTEKHSDELSVSLSELSSIVIDTDDMISGISEQKGYLRMCSLAARISNKSESDLAQISEAESKLNVLENTVGELRAIALILIRSTERFVSYALPDFAKRCEQALDATHRGKELHVGKAIRVVGTFRHTQDLLLCEAQEMIQRIESLLKKSK